MKMIDNRKALSSGYWIKFVQDSKIQIMNEIGRGASCIVYDGMLYDSANIMHRVRIKELYPISLPLGRDGNNNLSCAEEFMDKFALAKQRFRKTYFQGIVFRNTLGLTNSTINSTDIFEVNNTYYAIMALDEGMEYGKYCDKSLMEVFEHVKSLATAIKKYHEAGFLHLDLKPENIFVIPETPEHIYLFDFDSAVRIDQLKDGKIIELSYSEGYSAPEQVQGQIHMVGTHTDVYAIGAILFAKIFGRSPKIEDCRISSGYSFTNMVYYSESYRPELFRRLSRFFHKTLSASARNRWPDMKILIDELDKLIKLSNLEEQYLLSNFQYNSACFVGRFEELSEIHNALGENQVVFISGIGGIGKTELAKRYADEYKDYYDTVSFAYYDQCLEQTISQELVFHKFGLEEGECEKDVFLRLMSILRETASDRDLIIIDNFDVESDDRLEELLECPCKFLFTTRTDFRDYNFRQINVGRISNSGELVKLFSYYNDCNYGMEERKFIDKLIDFVDGHTMTVELISKYLRDAKFMPSELYGLFLEKEGVTNTDDTIVRQRKDRKMNVESVNRHLLILFDISNFDSISKEIIGSLSLFAGIRIKNELFVKICRVDGCERRLSRLINHGWIEYNEMNHKISLHQVIQDLIYSNYHPSTETCPRVSEGMYGYIKEEDANYSEGRIKRRVFGIFVNRLTGNDMLYARLCLEYGRIEKLEEAISICRGIENSDSYKVLVQALIKKIDFLGQCEDMFSEDSEDDSFEEYCEHVLEKIKGIFEQVIETCYKERDLGQQCMMLVDACNRIDGILGAQVLSLYFDSTIGQEKIFGRIIEIFDYVQGKIMQTDLSDDLKEKSLMLMRKFYSDEDMFLSLYRYEKYGNMDKAYEYQKMIGCLDKNKKEHSKNPDEIVFRIEPGEVKLENRANEYLSKGQYEKAIEAYNQACEAGECPYDFVASSIVEAYLKLGEPDKAIQCIEYVLAQDRKQKENPDMVGSYSCGLCIALIKILLQQDRMDEVKHFAQELISYEEHEIVDKEASEYVVSYVLLAYYYLFRVEEDSKLRKGHWEKCKMLFELLRFEELDEELYPFLYDYLSTENLSNQRIIDIMGRLDIWNRQLERKIELFQMLKGKEKGDEPVRLKIMLEIKEAELRNEYPYEKIKRAMECCNEAIKDMESIGQDKYFLNKALSMMAEVMSNDAQYNSEQVDSVRMKCDYYLIAQTECETGGLEKCIELWKDAARNYSLVEKYADEVCCLQQAEKLIMENLDKYDYCRFDRDLWYILRDAVRAYKNMNDYQSLRDLIKRKHRMAVQYYCKQSDRNLRDCIDKLKDLVWEYEIAEDNKMVVFESAYILHVITHYRKGNCRWEEKLESDALLYQLCGEIIENLDGLPAEFLDTVIDLREKMIEHMPDSLEDKVIQDVVSIISDKYQHNEIEFKKP